MNQQLALSSNPMPVSMLTVEIAELTGKRHDHVMRDTRKMLVELHGEEAAPKFGDSYRGADNTLRPCFRLPKRETMVLVTGYSIPLRARVIDRLEQLERQEQLRGVPFLPAEQPAAPSERLTTGIRLIKSAVVPAIIGGVKKAVVQPIIEKIEEVKSWTEDRFAAARQRDILQLDKQDETLGKLQALEKSQTAIQDAIEKVFITVHRPAPDARPAPEPPAAPAMVTIFEIVEIVGIPAEHRTRGLSYSLAHSARMWFAAQGHHTLARPKRSISRTWEYDRAHVAAWWSDAGRFTYETYLARHQES